MLILSVCAAGSVLTAKTRFGQCPPVDCYLPSGMKRFLSIITLLLLLKIVKGLEHYDTRNEFETHCKVDHSALFAFLPDFGCEEDVQMGPTCEYTCHGMLENGKGYFVSLWSNHYNMALFSAAIVKRKRRDPKGNRGEWNEDKRHGEDYRELPEYQRGHLFPLLYSSESIEDKLTMRLSNAVPQAREFNSGPWKAAEEKLKKEFIDRCPQKSGFLPIVVTGAVPNFYPETGNGGKPFRIVRRAGLREQQGITVPTHLWTQFVCYNVLGDSYHSATSFIGLNHRTGQVETHPKGISAILGTLYERMEIHRYEASSKMRRAEELHQDTSLLINLDIRKLMMEDHEARVKMLTENGILEDIDTDITLSADEMELGSPLGEPERKRRRERRKRSVETTAKSNQTLHCLKIIDGDSTSDFKLQECKIREEYNEGDAIETHIYNFDSNTLVEDSKVERGSTLTATYTGEDGDAVEAAKEVNQDETIFIVLRPR